MINIIARNKNFRAIITDLLCLMSTSPLTAGEAHVIFASLPDL